MTLALRELFSPIVEETETKKKPEQMPIEEAVQWCIDSRPRSKLKESIDMVIQLGIDPARSEHQVRTTIIPPGGSNKVHNICVATSLDNAEKAMEAGADFIADEKTYNEIKAEEFNFTKLIATKEVIKDLRQFARVLGPKGLFPNAKSKTLVNIDELEDVINDI